MVAEELVSVVVGKEVIGLRLARPGGFRGFKTVEGNPGWEVDGVGTPRVKMPGINAHKLALPQHAQRHFAGVESQIETLRIPDANPAVAHRTLPSAQLGGVTDSQFSGLPGQPHGLLGPVAIGQINPQGFDLPGRIALQQIGPPRTAFRPVTGHDDRRIESGRFPQIEMEPVFLKSVGNRRQINRPHLAGFLSIELVAGDATEPLTAHQFMPYAAE